MSQCEPVPAQPLGQPLLDTCQTLHREGFDLLGKEIISLQIFFFSILSLILSKMTF